MSSKVILHFFLNCQLLIKKQLFSNEGPKIYLGEQAWKFEIKKIKTTKFDVRL